MSLKWGLESVKSGWFKLSKSSEFNDPMDSIGNIYPVLPPALLNELGGDADFYRGMMKDKRQIDNAYRFLCLSAARKRGWYKSDPLLWAHYGDRGYGVRLTLDLPTDMPDGVNASKVKYCLSQPLSVCPCKRDALLSWLFHHYEKCISRKGLAWKYEREVRVMVDMLKVDQEDVYTDDRTGFSFLRIPPKTIKEVAFGVRVPNVMVSRHSKELREIQNLGHLKITKAEIDYDGYVYRYGAVDHEGASSRF